MHHSQNLLSIFANFFSTADRSVSGDVDEYNAEIGITPIRLTHSVSQHTRDVGNGQNLGNASSYQLNLFQKLISE